MNFLKSVKARDNAGAAEERIAPAWLRGKWMRGADFRVTTAHAILRHDGVGLGKLDFIGSMPVNDG